MRIDIKAFNQKQNEFQAMPLKYGVLMSQVNDYFALR